MSLVVRKSYKPRLAPQGTHLARLIWIVDLGFQATPWGAKRQVMFTFELVNEPISPDKNFIVSAKPLNLSVLPGSHLGQAIRAITGRYPDELDLAKLLNAPCTISIAHVQRGPKTFVDITRIEGVPERAHAPEAKSDLLIYDLEDPSTHDNYDRLPDWIKTKLTRIVGNDDEDEEEEEMTGIRAGTVFDDISF